MWARVAASPAFGSAAASAASRVRSSIRSIAFTSVLGRAADVKIWPVCALDELRQSGSLGRSADLAADLLDADAA